VIEKDNDKHAHDTDKHAHDKDEKDAKDFAKDEKHPRAHVDPLAEVTPFAITLNATTLAAAVSVTDDRIKLTSGATVVAGQMAYADREAFLLLAQVSPTDTTLWLVTRGYSGTPAEAHNSGANCKTGPQQNFLMFNPAGAANANNVVALPVINVLTGDAFDINANAWRQVGTGGVAQGTAVWP
jgi:hypothetical protein